MTRCRSVYSW